MTLWAETSNDTIVDQVKFYDNDEFIAKATVPPFQIVWDTNNVADGPHTLTVKATDFNEDEAFSAPVSVDVDNATPLIISPPFDLQVNVGTPFTHPVTANGKDQPLSWKHGKSAWDDIAPSHRGGLLLKIILRNAKLYSYTFTLPDPDGNLNRDKDNARWCEHIKHRSDNWDRKSNQPAIGLPPRE